MIENAQSIPKQRQKMPLFWVVNVGGPLALLALALAEHHWFFLRPHPCAATTPPTLSGSTEFTVLGLVVALAAYLRAVRANALDLRSKILAGKEWAYPPDFIAFPFTREKLMNLDDVSRSIEIASPFFLVLAVVISGRIVAETYIKYLAREPNCNGWLLTIDTIIALGITAGIAALALTHFSARAKDSTISRKARLAEDKTRKLLKEEPKDVGN